MSADTKKVVIYTAIFGDYDNLIDPVSTDDDVDYICFTDGDPRSDIWQIRQRSAHLPDDPVRSARVYKICPHRFLSGYDFSLWIDGNMRLNKTPNVPAMLRYGASLAMEKHRKRNCVYDEAEICIDRGLDDILNIRRAVIACQAMGIRKDTGLWASYMLARKHNDPDLVRLNEMWWAFVQAYSRRDQLSIPTVFNGYQIEPIGRNERSKIATIKKHKK